MAQEFGISDVKKDDELLHAICWMDRALSLAEVHVCTGLGQCSREAFAVLVMTGRGLSLPVRKKQISQALAMRLTFTSDEITPTNSDV